MRGPRTFHMNALRNGVYVNIDAIHESGRKLISFIIPCYHSEGSVGLVIDEIRQVVAQRPDFTYQIIAVNDCSPDGLLAVIRKEAENDPQVLAIDLAKNGGRHNALICGCHYADGDYIVFIDDDQQCPADRLWDLMDPILNGDADVSIAKYPHKTQSRFKNFGSAVNDTVVSVVTSTAIAQHQEITTAVAVIPFRQDLIPIKPPFVP